MKFSLPFVLLLLFSHYAYSQSALEALAGQLSEAGCYRAEASYEVLLPNADEPVAYTIDLMSYPAQADSLSPCDYLIDWTPRDTTVAGGFSAYFPGNYYRYRDGRLQENHFADNPTPFAPQGLASGGMQMQDQFAQLLPNFLGRKLRQMASDTTYICSVKTSDKGTTVSGSQSIRGYLCSEYTYSFDRQGRPTFMETTANPGQIAEQVITIRYAYPAANPECFEITEQKLIERHPLPFEKYRRSSFALESLRGEPLPAMAVPTLDRKRYARQRGDAFGAPTVVAVLDDAIDGTDKVVADLREALAALPFSADLILAFTGNNTEAIEEITGAPQPGERIVVSARSVARDCGITDYPSLIFCRADGTVADIHVGRNNRMREIVIEKVSLSR